MTDTGIISILVCGIVVLSLAVCGLSCVMWWKSHEKLMWFHGAGQSLAQHQLEMAKLELRSKEVSVEQARTELEAARVNAQTRARTPNGAHPQRLVAEV